MAATSTFLYFFSLLVIVCVSAEVSGKETKRSDDADRWEPVVNNLSNKIASLEAKLQALENKVQGQSVSFFTQFTEYHHTFASDNTPLVFDNVISNVGDGYNAASGHFVAPLSGTYAFYLNLLSDHDHTVWQNVCIMMNADCAALTQLADSASLSVVLRLRSGDAVWVMKRDGPGTSIFGINHTTFSGMLVTASE